MLEKRKIELGHYLKGAEPIGCFNTGVAPTIGRSKFSKKYIGKEYMVGRDIECTLNHVDNILLVMRGKQPEHIKFYSSAKKAWAEYDRLNKQMLDSNREQIEHVQNLRKRAGQGDMKAVLDLADY